MQRLGSNCLVAAAPAQTALFNLVRRLTCSQTHALHTTAAQLRRQDPSIDYSESDVEEERVPENYQPESSDSDLEGMSDSAGSTLKRLEDERFAAVIAADTAAQQQKHQGLDDLELNIILR